MLSKQKNTDLTITYLLLVKRSMNNERRELLKILPKTLEAVLVSLEQSEEPSSCPEITLLNDKSANLIHRFSESLVFGQRSKLFILYYIYSSKKANIVRLGD